MCQPVCPTWRRCGRVHECARYLQNRCSAIFPKLLAPATRFSSTRRRGCLIKYNTTHQQGESSAAIHLFASLTKVGASSSNVRSVSLSYSFKYSQRSSTSTELRNLGQGARRCCGMGPDDTVRGAVRPPRRLSSRQSSSKKSSAGTSTALEVAPMHSLHA